MTVKEPDWTNAWAVAMMEDGFLGYSVPYLKPTRRARYPSFYAVLLFRLLHPRVKMGRLRLWWLRHQMRKCEEYMRRP